MVMMNDKDQIQIIIIIMISITNVHSNEHKDYKKEVDCSRAEQSRTEREKRVIIIVL